MEGHGFDKQIQKISGQDNISFSTVPLIGGRD
jgi:hypothetical protein